MMKLTHILTLIPIVSLIGVASCNAPTGALLENNPTGQGNRPQELAQGMSTPSGEAACILVETG